MTFDSNRTMGAQIYLLAFRYCLCWQLVITSASGFAALPSSQHDTGAGFAPLPIPPKPPADKIDETHLLQQAYEILTVNHLRSLLRDIGAKVSGNKRDLVDRLGQILVVDVSTNANISKSQKSDSYDHLRIKDLKGLLRERGAKVSGNKRELVERLLQYDQTQSQRDDELQSNLLVESESVEWSLLNPSITLIESSRESLKASVENDGSIELPCLSGLIFVNKPSAWSTLPTKQQLDNPSCPNYPCLSDSVKNWLRTHPGGKRRMQNAQEEQEKWWDLKLRSMSRNPKLQKKWAKRRDKQKGSTFDPRPVHRLDIDTSGIVCIALTPYALRAANMMFEQKSLGSFEYADPNIDQHKSNDEIGVQKRYSALVEGALHNRPPNTICNAIGKVFIDDHNEWACDIANDGSVAFIRPGDSTTYDFVPGSLREAVTSYQVVDWLTAKQTEKDAVNSTRVELTPHTGRGHQLRLHLASIGHPIVGDYMHGKSFRPDGIPTTRLCLHASELSMSAWCAVGTGDGSRFQLCRVSVKSSPPF